MDDVRKKLINLRLYIWQLVNLNHIYMHFSFHLVNIYASWLVDSTLD